MNSIIVVLLIVLIILFFTMFLKKVIKNNNQIVENFESHKYDYKLNKNLQQKLNKIRKNISE